MNENQVSTYKTEKGELFSQVMQFDKTFDKINFRYRMWGFLRRNAVRGFWAPFELHNFFLILINIILRFIIITILFCICQDFLTCLLVYAIPHILVLIGSFVGECITCRQLIKLEKEINEKYDMYAEKQYAQYCITNRNSVVFDNNVLVENGLIQFPMAGDFGNIKIFRLLDEDNKSSYNSIKTEISGGYSNLTLIDKHIPSIQFKKNFGVVTDKDNTIRALNYLSPTVQMNMINHIKELENYTIIRTENGIMKLGTNRYVNPPGSFDVLDKYSSVIGYFDEIDRHCQELLNMGYTALRELQNLEFLKGYI